MIDLEALLAEANEAPPCGPNLEHDLIFFELEEAARGKAEQQIGDAVKPAEDPNWPKVLTLAEGLLLRTKDVRIAVHLTRALTRIEGIAGLTGGLGLVHGLLERYWDTVHPALDAEYDNDPTERLNAVAPLADPEAGLRDIREAFLIDTREHGQLQVREIEIALGRLAAPASAGGATARSLGQLHAQIAKALDRNDPMVVALREGREHVLGIQALVSDRAGARGILDLKPLLQGIDNVLEVCDAALGTATEAEAEETEPGAPGSGTFRLGGAIGSRDEALRALDLVCEYLTRHEPSNPAPLLIRRAQRLMTMSFLEIVKDLLPDSLSNIERLAGEVESQ